jgi:hypothetical protein
MGIDNSIGMAHRTDSKIIPPPDKNAVEVDDSFRNIHQHAVATSHGTDVLTQPPHAYPSRVNAKIGVARAR